jgi:hypothetical protein
VIDEDGKNLLIYVNFSKTKQYQRSFHVIPIPANDDPALDLFRHVKNCCQCQDWTLPSILATVSEEGGLVICMALEEPP